MTTNDLIRLARKHVDNAAPMHSSAVLCLSDALRLYEAGDYVHARKRALRSLAYSVGILHSDYQRAERSL